jgi:hypothetical protein
MMELEKIEKKMMEDMEEQEKLKKDLEEEKKDIEEKKKKLEEAIDE